jgi:hypothetical protein
MSYGIQLLNSSGQIAFDSSRLGGVALDSFLLSMTANTNYTYNYTIPNGSNIKINICPQSGAYRSDLLTVTKTIAGTSATIVINPGAVSLIASVTFILV